MKKFEWINKTKKKLREEERKERIIEYFTNVFGEKPDVLVWQGGYLEAKKSVSLHDKDLEFYDDLDEEWVRYMIEGMVVIGITYAVREQDEANGYDLDWRLSKERYNDVMCYRWTKRDGNYLLYVEIHTLIN